MDSRIREAISAIKSGNNPAARRLLVQVLNDDPRNETAWLLMSAAVTDPHKKRQSLQMVLEINPGNERAKTLLATLAKQPTSEDSAVRAVEEAPTTTKPVHSSPYLILASVGGVLLICMALLVTALVVSNLRNRRADGASTQTAEVAISSEIVSTAEPVIPTSAPLLPATNTALPPTATPLEERVVCRQEATNYIDDINPLILEFFDTMEVANSTARIALSPVIQDLQAIRREIESIPAPSCVKPASTVLISGIDNLISGLISFMGDAGDATIDRYINQGLHELETGREQMFALAAGRPTPQAQPLPTNTPLPTPLPTASPLPVGSSIVVGDWQIRVNRVEIRSELPFQDEITRAAGRYAIVFLTVTNRGRRPETYISFGTVDVVDAEGRHYEEDSLGSFYAYLLYENQIDMGVNVNPDASANVVSVFDISPQSAYYVLAPGSLADPYSQSVYLPIE